MHAWRSAAAALVADLKQVFAGRLRSVVAYGPHLDGHQETALTCLALVDSLGLSDLDACARLSPKWARQQLATPLILPGDEFRRSLDAFPLEYSEIVRRHELVFGDDPFDGVVISHEDLRRACETQIKSHLVHLRESYVESAGHPQAVANLVTTSAAAFVTLLRNVARLNGSAAAERVDATREGARAVGLSDAVVNDLIGLEHRPAIPMTDAARLFPDYLAAVEQLARAVDRWRA